MSIPVTPYRRPQLATLLARLREPRRFLQVVAGARQVGKSTLVEQAIAELDTPALSVSADEPTLHDAAWLAAQWQRARALAASATAADGGAFLVVDEVQKVPAWSETVKRLWDEDTRAHRPLRVVLLGSAPLRLQQGLTESLAGRFELLHLPHWSFAEMRAAFRFTLDEYLWFGGYPGGAPLIGEPERWRRYLQDALIETTIGRDVLLMTRVDKPALLRQLFQLGCRYSGQIVSYTKLLGQLHDAGNTTTLAHYLELLRGAGMLAGLPKYSGSVVRQRGSTPKLQVFNSALMSALSEFTPADLATERDFRGRLVESAVGAHLLNAASQGRLELSWWREANREVDFVVRSSKTLLALEVKSGAAKSSLPGLAAFAAKFRGAKLLQVGGSDGVPLEEFLASEVESWWAG